MKVYILKKVTRDLVKRVDQQQQQGVLVCFCHKRPFLIGQPSKRYVIHNFVYIKTSITFVSFRVTTALDRN